MIISSRQKGVLFIELLLILPIAGLLILGIALTSVRLIKYLEASSAANQGLLYANTLAELEIGDSNQVGKVKLTSVRDRVIAVLKGYRHFISDHKKGMFYFDNKSSVGDAVYKDNVTVTHTVGDASLDFMSDQTVISVDVTLPEESYFFLFPSSLIGQVQVTAKGPYLFRRLE